jgi:hypothetical protein
MIEVYWMVSIEVAASRDGVSITRPESSGVVCGVQLERYQCLDLFKVQHEAYLEWVRVLAESVEVRILGKLSTKSQILGLEDELCSGSVE